jgi:hypothetical protein
MTMGYNTLLGIKFNERTLGGKVDEAVESQFRRAAEVGERLPVPVPAASPTCVGTGSRHQAVRPL